MTSHDDQQFLQRAFLSNVKVFDAQKGYLSVPPFNLRINPAVLQASARLIASRFKDRDVQIVHGIPHSGSYLATAVTMQLGVHLHASRKDSAVPTFWKEVYRREVKAFAHISAGLDIYAGLNFSFVRKGDKVLLVDDVCASGQTGVAIIEGLLERGVHVVGFAVQFDKVFQGGLARIENLGVPVFSCVRVKEIGKNDTVKLL